MTEPNSSVVRVPADVPNIYADSVMDCVYGIHTTKVVFGVEQGPSVPSRPAGVITIPTALLFAAALQILRDISSPALAAEMRGRLAQFVQQLEAVQGFAQQAIDKIGAATAPPP